MLAKSNATIEDLAQIAAALLAVLRRPARDTATYVQTAAAIPPTRPMAGIASKNVIESLERVLRLRFLESASATGGLH